MRSRWRPIAYKTLVRGISIFTRRSLGFMCRSSGRTGSTCLRWRATGCRRRLCSARPRLPNPATSAAARWRTVHVHPNGRFVYVANRASSTLGEGAQRVFAGGENTLAVFAIDPATGEPEAIQHVDTRGIHCRTFHIDPSGRILVAAHIIGLPVRDGAATRIVPACLSLFRIGNDGRLDFVRKYDVEVGSEQMFWMGMA